MEGKKIAFIVVAIATVGGIGYYLYKRNKNSVSSISSVFSAEEKARASAQASARIKSLALQTVKMDRDKYIQARTVAGQGYSKDLYE
jgi:hypothetical protein